MKDLDNTRFSSAHVRFTSFFFSVCISLEIRTLINSRHPKETFKSGKTLTYDWRLSQLKAIETMLVQEKERIAGALAADACL